jgi:hypothetical protein
VRDLFLCAKYLFVAATVPPFVRSFGQPAPPEPKRPEPYGQSAPRPHEIANGEIEADEHREHDKPLMRRRKLRWMLLAADGDYRKVGNGTTTRALRFVSILKFHHSSNRSHQGHGKRRKASGRS